MIMACSSRQRTADSVTTPPQPLPDPSVAGNLKQTSSVERRERLEESTLKRRSEWTSLCRATTAAAAADDKARCFGALLLPPPPPPPPPVLLRFLFALSAPCSLLVVMVPVPVLVVLVRALAVALALAVVSVEACEACESDGSPGTNCRCLEGSHATLTRPAPTSATRLPSSSKTA